jgi:NAD(P)-dependent dehydrogenase (short-subunit alcohol dehydrogenase family)
VTELDPLAAFRLEGRTAIVTGASSGLGARFARVLAAAGAQVVVAARRQDRIEALAREIGGRAVACDVTDEAGRERLVEAALESGRLDVLVNNAGITNVRRAEDESLEEIERMVATNLVAPFALCQLAGRAMLERGSGSIVNVASVYGLVSSEREKVASYVATKHGLVGLTRDLGVQWARKGVRVNAIAPGFFPSEMTQNTIGDERWLAWMGNRVPYGRPGREGELDGALLFLASDASSYVTGQVIAVDGGMTAA